MKMIKQHPKLYVMDNGTMRMDKNYMIAMHNPATIDHPNQPNEFVEFPVYTVLIDHQKAKFYLILHAIQTRWVQKGDGVNLRKKHFLLICQKNAIYIIV